MADGSVEIGQLREALRESPNNLSLRSLLAESLKRANRCAEAATEFRGILAISPNYPSAEFGLAQCLYNTGDFAGAAASLEKLVAVAPAGAEYRMLLARTLNMLGRKDEARSHYEKALAIRPGLDDSEFAVELMGEKPSARQRLRVVAGGDANSRGAIEGAEERPKVKFDDVGGMESVKESIRMSVIYPLQHPEMYEAYGKKIGGGILLYGPPGCGKTHIARATAGEVGFTFIHVGIEEVLDMWLGNSEKNLHGVFDKARRLAPSVLFFDEVEALGGKRTSMSSHTAKPLVNQFLAEMDGMGASNDRVLIMGATNAPWDLDPALRRPGRFDQVIFVPPPDLPARIDVLRIHLKKKPADEIDLVKIAKQTDRFSGADLAGIVEVATGVALKDAMKTGKIRKLTTKDLAVSAAQSRPTTSEWFSTVRNFIQYSNEGGAYDQVKEYLG